MKYVEIHPKLKVNEMLVLRLAHHHMSMRMDVPETYLGSRQTSYEHVNGRSRDVSRIPSNTYDRAICEK